MLNVVVVVVVFTRAIADAEAIAYHYHLVMSDPVVSQSKTVLCTKPETHNADAPF